MRVMVAALLLVFGTGLAGEARAQGFAALVSPPRFELSAQGGKTLRSVFEISNRSTAPAKYTVHTADWSLSPDFSVNFQEELQPGSCRPWVALERPEVIVPGAGTLRYRFEEDAIVINWGWFFRQETIVIRLARILFLPLKPR